MLLPDSEFEARIVVLVFLVLGSVVMSEFFGDFFDDWSTSSSTRRRVDDGADLISCVVSVAAE